MKLYPIPMVRSFTIRLSDCCYFIVLITDRGEVQKGSAEIFFRKVKFWEDGGLLEAPPVFVGIIFLNQAEHIIMCFKLERVWNIGTLLIIIK